MNCQFKKNVITLMFLYIYYIDNYSTPYILYKISQQTKKRLTTRDKNIINELCLSENILLLSFNLFTRIHQSLLFLIDNKYTHQRGEVLYFDNY